MNVIRPMVVRRAGEPNRTAILRIIRLRYEAGDRPPTQRELETELGIGRSTVKHHLLALDALGLIRFRHGIRRGIEYIPPAPGNEQ